MESIGVKLKMDDYKKIFESIDYDNEGEIDFTKFCLLNTDRKVDLNELVIHISINIYIEREHAKEKG
jgi:Ca2+-binding EF-hand superfamily protein